MNRCAMLLMAALVLGGSVNLGCSHEVEHKETEKPNLFGGHTVTSETKTENADGSITDRKSEHKTSE